MKISENYIVQTNAFIPNSRLSWVGKERYRYTPGDEREIKTALNAFEYTLTNSAKAPLASYCGQIKTISSPPWTFNNNDLYDVILENHDRSMENSNVYGGYLEDYYQKLGSGNLNTLLMATPNEYNVFGNSATPIITYKLVANRTFNSITMSYNNQNNATWEKQYNFINYQGSIIGKQSANAWNNPVLKYATYYPFAPGLSASDMDSKLSWLGKEKDRYSQHTILGVRTYNDETRRFEQVDRLWEDYPGWTPYQYCGNDPVNKVDVDGKEIKFKPTNSPENKNDEKTFDAAMYELGGTPTGRSIIFTLDVIYKDIPVTIEFVNEGSIPDVKDQKGNVKFIIYGEANANGFAKDNTCDNVKIIVERNAKMSYRDLLGHELWHAIQAVTGYKKYFETWDSEQILPYDMQSLEQDAYQQQSKIKLESEQNANSQLEIVQ